MAKENGIEGEYLVVIDERAVNMNGGLPGSSSFGTSDANGIGVLTSESIGIYAGTLQKIGKMNVNKIYTKAVSGFSVTGADQATMERIVAADKYIAYVEQNQIFKAVVEDIDQSPATWGIDRIDKRDLALDNRYTVSGTGEGVTAYIIDTGVQITHNEFKVQGDNTQSRATWGTNTSGDGEDRDCNGHGTHVAGTVGGLTHGVAKNVNIVGVKVLACNGFGSTTGVINGVEWVMNDAQGKLATANMSLGGGASSSLDTAVKNLVNSGVPTVVAAGNDNGDACTKSPAREETAITVGSTTNTDARSSFSNYGTCLDLFAPGSGITAAYIGNDDSTRSLSGTSMASPHVCGGVALLLEKGITSANIVEEIVNRATDDKVTDPRTGSPNKLLYVGEVGPTNAPTPAPPTPAPTPCIESTVTVEITTDNYPLETSWILSNACTEPDEEVVSQPAGYYSAAGTTYTEEKCVPNGRYRFTISDSYGDGMCCGYGSGDYKVTYNGVVVKSGGQFGSSESTLFGTCPDALSGTPTDIPTVPPTAPPTAPPTRLPTATPTVPPTRLPTSLPTATPTAPPTSLPTDLPTSPPTGPPTGSPINPTNSPTPSPIADPTKAPTISPTSQPTVSPSVSPSNTPMAPVDSPVSPPEYESIWEEGFEKGFGKFKREPGSKVDAALTKSRRKTGQRSARIRDNTDTSMITTKAPTDVSGFSDLNISFYYNGQLKEGESFRLEVKFDDGEWTTAGEYVRGENGFTNKKWIESVVNVEPISDEMSIRFVCNADTNRGKVWLDDISLTGLRKDESSDESPDEPTPPTPAPTLAVEDWVISRDRRCGASEFDARNNCRKTCSLNSECDPGQYCWIVHDNYCGSKPDPNPTCNNPGYGHRCGATELLARETCGPECRWAGDCAVGTCHTLQSNLCHCS